MDRENSPGIAFPDTVGRINEEQEFNCGGFILVVDDDKDLADLIAVLVGEGGCPVETAYHPHIALEKVAKGKVAGLRLCKMFCDGHMPDMSGEELVTIVGQDHSGLDVTFITAASEERVKVLRSEFGRVITKPFDNDQVVEIGVKLRGSCRFIVPQV